MRTFLLAVLSLAAAGHCPAGTLETRSFTITIEVRCPEGSVTCDDVKYTAINKKTGQSITLTGRTRHTMGRDGVTPSRFLGYEFRNKGYVYFVHEAGRLTVTRGSTVVVDENGTWK